MYIHVYSKAVFILWKLEYSHEHLLNIRYNAVIIYQRIWFFFKEIGGPERYCRFHFYINIFHKTWVCDFQLQDILVLVLIATEPFSIFRFFLLTTTDLRRQDRAPLHIGVFCGFFSASILIIEDWTLLESVLWLREVLHFPRY
jgi:hypothetical protein